MAGAEKKPIAPKIYVGATQFDHDFEPVLKSEIFLHEAARKNNFDEVRRLLMERVDVNSRNNLDRTALHWAAANGHDRVMELLITAGADIEAQDKYGMRALLWAAWFGHLDALKYLLNNGANIQCQNKQGLNMLHCAAQNNHLHIIRYIFDSVENFDANAVEKDEKTPLHLAAEKGHQEALGILLEHRCNVNIKDKGGQTAMHAAAAHGQDVALKTMSGFADVEISDRDTEGRTALHLAAEHGHLAALNVLLDQGADVNAENTQGNTALHLAAINNHPEVAQVLIDAFCELNVLNKRNQTALHASVESGYADVVEVLLIAGANVDGREKTGKTPLQMASRGSYIGIVDMIIKADRFQQTQRQQQQQQQQQHPEGSIDMVDQDVDDVGRLSSSVVQVPNGDIQFKRVDHDTAEFMKAILWKLATKQLRPNEWKKLAHHWGFNDNHIKAIEHQYTGPNSYKEHGYRLLLIWLHGVKKEESPVKHLFEGLVAAGRRDLGEQIRRRATAQVQGRGNACLVS